MSVRLAPVHDPAALRRVHLMVRVAVRLTATGYSSGPDSAEHLIERSLVHSKAVVPLGEIGIPLIEVERETRIDVYRCERPHARGSPGYAEQRRELPGRGLPVPRRDHDVVEIDLRRAHSRNAVVSP